MIIYVSDTKGRSIYQGLLASVVPSSADSSKFVSRIQKLHFNMPHTSKAGPSAEALPGAISWAPNLQHSLSNTAPPATNPPKEPLTFRAVGEGEWTVLEYSQEKGVSEPIGAAEITDGIGVYARVTPEHVLIAHITSDIWKNQQCDSGLYEMWSQKKESAKEKKKNAKEMKKNAKEIKDIEENIKKNIAQVLNCLVRLGTTSVP